jgi:hypothetical protein
MTATLWCSALPAGRRGGLCRALRWGCHGRERHRDLGRQESRLQRLEAHGEHAKLYEVKGGIAPFPFISSSHRDSGVRMCGRDCRKSPYNQTDQTAVVRHNVGICSHSRVHSRRHHTAMHSRSYHN